MSLMSPTNRSATYGDELFRVSSPSGKITALGASVSAPMAAPVRQVFALVDTDLLLEAHAQDDRTDGCDGDGCKQSRELVQAIFAATEVVLRLLLNPGESEFMSPASRDQLL